MEIITGVDMSKKSLPKTLVKEIALKKKSRLKESVSISALGLVNKYSTKDLKHKKNKQLNDIKIIEMVKDYRKKVGQRTGGIKLYAELKQGFIIQRIKIGRDKFYDVLRLHSLLVPKLKNYVTTTNSNHQFRKYKNRIKDQVTTRPEQLWVSDITYIKTDNGHNYLAIVTDAYSKQIMGYNLDSHMKTSLCTKALEMAIKNRKYPDEQLTHHSDRGFQYCNPKYTQFAENNGIIMSRT
jgi:putative transposase